MMKILVLTFYNVKIFIVDLLFGSIILLFD